MSEWQPIETAPRDQPILVWDGSAISVAKFHRQYGAMALADGDRACDANGDGVYLIATHWMPLPEPPKT